MQNLDCNITSIPYSVRIIPIISQLSSMMLPLMVVMNCSVNISNFIILAKQSMSILKIPKERLLWKISTWQLTITVVLIQLLSIWMEMINLLERMC